MTRFALQLFGAFQFWRDEQPIDKFRSDKVRALLAYLALSSGMPIRRVQLIELLWDGYTKQAARASLRTALHNLRELLAPLPLLETTHQTVRFVTNHPAWWCDVELVTELLTPTAQLDLTRQHTIETLVNQSFLPNFATVDSQPFQRWRQAQAEFYQAQFLPLRNQIASRLYQLARRLPVLPADDPLIGEIQQRILSPYPRLLTLLGNDEIYQLQLAVTVGQTLHRHFREGVRMISLTAPSALTEEQLAMTIGMRLGLTMNTSEPSADQLCRQLRQWQVLLIFGPLMESETTLTGLLVKLLQTAPAIRILVLARQRLRLQAEFVLVLPATPQPTA